MSVPTGPVTADIEQLAESEAVALFVQRASAIRADFRLSADNAPLVIAIVQRLDGLPLAIELAASRTKLLPLRALIDRLQKSLDILQSTAADRTDRQRTLRGAIAWSYDLLSETEKTLFRRCAVFVGGWRLEDADEVVAEAGNLLGDLLDCTAALVDHSLVRRVDTDADFRLMMLETIREFGREQLSASGELTATSDAHARHFAGLAEQAEPRLTFGREWPDRLEADHANIRAALAWLADRDIRRALLTAGRLWRFWHLRGHLREGAAMLSDLLERPAAMRRDEARAKALVGLAGLVYWQTDYQLARRSYEEAQSIAAEIGNEEFEVESLYSLAYVRAIERDWDAANRDLRRAETMYEKQGNRLMATWALESTGMIMTLRGEHLAALPLLEESSRRFEELGDSFGMRNSLAVETRALMNLGRLEQAISLNRRVLEMSAAGQDVTSLSAAILDAASLAALEGDFERAAILTGAAQRIVHESGGQAPPELVNRIDALLVLQRELDPSRLADLLAEGGRLSTDQAVELALGVQA
jgi:tetratricopeptide (TPR) repeat protein